VLEKEVTGRRIRRSRGCRLLQSTEGKQVENEPCVITTSGRVVKVVDKDRVMLPAHPPDVTCTSVFPK